MTRKCPRSSGLGPINRFNSSRYRRSINMLRNVDLPEAIVFYGMDSILDRVSDTSSSIVNSKLSVKPGVMRLLKECREVGTPAIILSEHSETANEIACIVDGADSEFSVLAEEGILYYRSSRQEDYEVFIKDWTDYNCDEAPTFLGKGLGHAPSPAALLDAVNSIKISPRGFGGSSGFGIKYADAIRQPLPQHVVVFVSACSDVNVHRKSKSQFDSVGNSSLSRDRCIAARTAGMRVIYLEDGENSCTAEDVSDGIVDSLGSEEDWIMVTLDDVSTPGSFWLNMAQPRDEDGNRVDVEGVAKLFLKERAIQLEDGSTKDDVIPHLGDEDDIGEDDISSILADLDSL